MVNKIADACIIYAHKNKAQLIAHDEQKLHPLSVMNDYINQNFIYVSNDSKYNIINAIKCY